MTSGIHDAVRSNQTMRSVPGKSLTPIANLALIAAHAGTLS